MPSVRAQGPTHTDPGAVTLQAALEALADPVRRSILRQLADSPEWARPCGTFDLAVTKATSSHHFAVPRDAGLIEQRDQGARRLNRLRTDEFERHFPGLLRLVLNDTESART